MNYPIHLIPNKSYNKIKWHTDLNNHYLIRFTDSEDFKDNDGKIKVTSIRSEHVSDFSTNLLGIFTVKDIYIEICGPDKIYFNNDWKVGTEVNIPKYEKDFKYNLIRGYFFLYIYDLQNTVFAKYDDATKIALHCQVIHTPKNWNFWHFSLRWFYDSLDLNTCPSKNARHRILSSAKAFIIEKAIIIKEPCYQELDAIHYMNK